MAKKRANGEGNIRKRKDGRWEGRYVIGRNEKGLPKTKNVLAKTKRECEEKLKGMGFVRTYRSFLVNMYHIRCLEKENVLLDNGERLYVSRRRYPEVKLTFENYIRHLDFMR